MNNATLLYSFLAVLAGVAVPILAAINSAYGQAINNIHWASLTLCVVAFITILTVTIANGVSMPSLATFQQASWWHLLGGCFFAVYVVLITFVAPKIGLGNAIIFVVVAQMFTAITIDHFGLLGAAVQHLDWKRALGIAFLIAGVALARSVPTSAGI